MFPRAAGSASWGTSAPDRKNCGALIAATTCTASNSVRAILPNRSPIDAPTAPESVPTATSIHAGRVVDIPSTVMRNVTVTSDWTTDVGYALIGRHLTAEILPSSTIAC